MKKCHLPKIIFCGSKVYIAIFCPKIRGPKKTKNLSVISRLGTSIYYCGAYIIQVRRRWGVKATFDDPNGYVCVKVLTIWVQPQIVYRVLCLVAKKNVFLHHALLADSHDQVVVLFAFAQ